MAESTMTRTVANNEAYPEPAANETNEHKSFMRIIRHLFRSKRPAAVLVWTHDDGSRVPEAQAFSDEEPKAYIIPSCDEKERNLKYKDRKQVVGGYTTGHNKAGKATRQHNLTAVEGVATASSTGGVLHNDADDEAVQINIVTSSVSPDIFKNLCPNGNGSRQGTATLSPGGVGFLVVEDNRVNQRLALKVFQTRAHRTPTILENGLLAVSAYKADPAAFRCILMDWSMPVMGGAEATREIRAFEANYGLRPCVILAMFPRGGMRDQEKVLEAGCDGFLFKPLRVRSLMTLLFGDEKQNILHQRGDLTKEEALSLSLGPRPPYLEPTQPAPPNPAQPQPRYPPLQLPQLLAPKPEDVDKTAPKFILARAVLKKVRSTFKNTNLEYERVLGYGGFGVAVKFSQKDETGKHLRHVVVKAPVRPDRQSTLDSLEHEYKWYNYLKGMEHVPYLVNPLPLYRFPLPPPESGEEPEYLGDRDFLASPGHFLITEFLEHGELITLVQRLNDIAMAQPNSDTSPKLTFIPNRLLWRFFLCFVRSTFAMAWPWAAYSWHQDYMHRHKNDVPPPTDQEVDDMLVDHPYREHVWETNDEVQIQNVVHFDIDLHNIFLGQSRNPHDEEHKYFRAVAIADGGMVQLGDWGLCTHFQDTDGMPRDQMKSYEGYGKTAYMAPEQFLGMPDDLKMWDYRTNLWGIGLAMCSLMTKGRLKGDPKQKFCQDATFTYPDGTKMIVPQTYAWFLENDITIAGFVGVTQINRLDIDLRYTVATLMSRDMDIRGTLDLLLLNVEGQIKEIDQKAKRGELQEWESDAALQRFVDEYLKNAPETVFAAGAALEAPTPPPPQPPVGATVQQFGNMNIGGGP
ncbi:hypothetical protein PG993_006087 [Apiospora rasikravindrae]|uniref:Protein kinase domain-containing protein n=1 Tax=Apiospora rasikravindrae TaxID=990691 RepID=A0ABR1TB85_9PEZI